MKIIFLQNVEDHKVGDVKEVAEGYARNYLLRRGLAEIATEEKVKELEGQIAKLKKSEAENVKKSKDIAEKMSKKAIVITEEVNEEGHLYGSVGTKEIAEKLEALGFEIDSADVVIEEPIKELGEHEIIVKVGHGVETSVKIKIERL
jgi:large subunit ribosomal protein L9